MAPDDLDDGGEASAPIQARLGPYDLTVDLGESASLRLDAEGRWCSLRLGARRHRRLLSGEAATVVAGIGEPIGWPASAVVHERARELAAELRRRALAAAAGSSVLARIAEWCQRAETWRADRWAAEASAYRAAYLEPVAMLPPDRYGDLVVQPALGCPHATCSFCVLYRDRRFRLLSDDEFERHLAAVCALHGRSLGRRSGAFLGSANALAVPTALLVRRLRQVGAVVGPLRRGFAAFWDPDHSPERTAGDWHDLVAGGLREVCAGLESGLPELRQGLGKEPDVSRFVARLRSAHAAGVALAVTVLAGVAGAGEASHVAATADVLRALQLATEDIVYVSPLWSETGLPRASIDLGPIVATLRQATAARVAPYRVERFRHYA